MSEREEIGRVKSVFLGIEDHGILTFMVMLDFGGSGQGFGTYTLDTYDHVKKRRVGTAFGCEALLRLIEFFGGTTLDAAKGQAVIAVRDGVGLGSTIRKLKRLPCDGGAEYDIEAILAEWRNADGTAR